MSQSHSNQPAPQGNLSSRDAAALVEHVAEVSQAGLPLPDGLRAAAQETTSCRLARELNHLAEQIEAGQPLDEALHARRGQYPNYVAGMIHAAMRTGRLSSVLLDLIEWQRTQSEVRRSLRSTFAYPLTLLALTALTLLGLGKLLIEPMLNMFSEFELQLPYVTIALQWLSTSGFTLAMWSLLVLAFGLPLLRWIVGPARWRNAIATVPLIGVLWQWSGVAEWSRLLAVLIEQRLTLPESLRLAAGGIRDAHVALVSRRLADAMEQGRTLTESLERERSIPASLVPIVRWGERTDRLGEALRVGAEMFDQRVFMRSELLKSIMPPLLFILVATLALMLIAGLYAPMLTLIEAMSF
jgi:general secretion pathway protein F